MINQVFIHKKTNERKIRISLFEINDYRKANEKEMKEYYDKKLDN